ncbi:MAG TPA: ABC transporter ATP-binding protein [Alphaproteobacteria bacterium]|nr:ABC transporter ATP-binding protein [Alphaproteobacteria bacterium]
MSLIEVDRLAVALDGEGGTLRLVREVSFTIEQGETLGIVGESGSGKSMTALAIMGLLPRGATASGRIVLDGEDLLAAGEARLCALRGDRIAMIFQEPMTSLNPVHRIGDQVAETLVLHRAMTRGQARREAVGLLDRVGLAQAASRALAYPHELSGGQRQRAMIAIALACRPALLIADEPTSALDVTVQAQIVRLLRDLAGEIGMALLLISHDLGVIGQLADRVQVMYGGRIVEAGTTRDVFRRRAHPYTQGLFAAVPTRAARKGRRLVAIPGVVPSPEQLPPGCPFYGRCPKGVERCLSDPPAVAIDKGHHARCFFAEAAP